jgi:Inosine-uridine preferring nucleoside hydrolase
MSALSRRKFIGAAAGGAASLLATSCKKPPGPEGAAAVSRPALIHATDLFRPHIDPDDHFDLATVFALAVQGRFELRAVMIDHPPSGAEVDPDVQAVAQLARITGLAVPVLTGTPRRLDPAEASRPENREATTGIRAILKLLRESPVPVMISIVGSCRDIALAGRLEPKLFAEKCAGIFLNAGSGTPDRVQAARLEYNVNLDPHSYAAIFDLSCPVYWLPCFEVAPGGGVPWAVAEYGTFYRFLQKDLFLRLGPRLRNYFLFMLKQGESEREHQTEADALRPSWLRELEGPTDEALLERQSARWRNMWSTAGFFHAAGLAVTTAGAIVERAGPAASGPPVFTLDPIRVRCGPDGVTEWSSDAASRDRFIIHIRDKERYPAAMTAALGDLLGSL